MYEDRLTKMKESNENCLMKIESLMNDNTNLMERLKNALKLTLEKNIQIDAD